MFTGSSPTTRETSTASAGVRPTGYDVVRYAVAAVLVAAAVLKAHQAATDPAARAGLRGDGPLWFQIALVQLELFVAAWLLSDLHPAAARRAAIGLFAVFGAVSFYRLLSRREDCGCFGATPIHPGWTFALDVVTLTALCRWPSVHGKPFSDQTAPLTPRRAIWRATHATTPLVIMYAAGLWMTGRLAARPAPPVGASDATAGLLLWQPDEWMGKRWPFLRYIKLGDGRGTDLAAGQWLVVLYRKDCPDCRAIIPHFEQLAQALTRAPGAPGILLVEVPSSGGASGDAADGEAHHFATAARLEAPPGRVVLRTPSAVWIADGRVLRTFAEAGEALSVFTPAATDAAVRPGPPAR